MSETEQHLLSPGGLVASAGLFAALEQAAGAIARLDQALDNHPLLPAFLYRARLEAVRRQAAVDGHGIDPWHLAATIEGLRLRMDHALGIVDRAAIFEAARTAFGLHQWLTAPDFEQEREVQAAAQHLAAMDMPSVLLLAATRTHAWLREGGARPPIRAALVRFWVTKRLLRAEVPLTGPRALAAQAPEQPTEWACAFLASLADEACDYHQLLLDLERGWLSARAKVAGRRSTSRASLVVDVLAAAPLLSATTLAGAVGMSIKSATEVLDDFVAREIVVEVTHRSARRLFGLAGLAPLRDQVAPPRRPEPGRGRGRPRIDREERAPAGLPPLLVPRPSPIERRAFDYHDIEHWTAHADRVIRDTRRGLDQVARGD